MLQNHSYLQKLWDKGIDISANVATSLIAAVIVGLVGLAFWKLKLRLELRAEETKKKLHYRMEDERAEKAKRRDAAERDETMRRELEEIALAVEAALTLGAQGVAWKNFEGFLRRCDIQRIQANSELAAGWKTWTLTMEKAAGFSAAPPHNAVKMAELIRATTLPSRVGG